MSSFNWSFTRAGIAMFVLIACAPAHAGLGVPSICKVPSYEGYSPDHTIELTTGAWTNGDPSQCSIVDASQIVNDGTNNGYHPDPNKRTNACGEITIAQDDTVLIDAGGRTFLVTMELFFTRNITVVRNGKFVAQGSRVFRVANLATLGLEQVQMSGGATSSFGGLILVEQEGNLSTYESRFENSVSDLDGGAIAFQSHGNLNIRKTLFKGNHADRNGGALMISGSEFAFIEESRITGNTAGSGGGVYADGLPDIEITASYIEKNRAIGGDGGGMFSGARIAVRCTRFLENQAESGNGGGLYQQPVSGLAFIESSYFEGNKTGTENKGLGGAVFVADDFTLLMSSIVGNEAKRGGGLYIAQYAADDPISIENVTIAHNNATIEGGALWITGDNAIVEPDTEDSMSPSLFGAEFSFQVLNNTIYANTAENGQIFIFDSGVDASEEIIFLNNIIDQPVNSTINCQGNVGRLLTRRPNDLSNASFNSQWPGNSCGTEFIGAHAAGSVQFGGLFKQGYAETISPDLGDIIACANVLGKDQFRRMSKCQLGAVRRGPPPLVDDPKAPE